MAIDLKICSNPFCCEITSSFVEGSTECIKCMTFEPRERKEKVKKKTKKFDKNDYDFARVKEDRERDRKAKRKQKKIFF